MKKMNPKQWIGAALLILGVIALIISHSIKEQVGAEMGNVKSITGPLSNTGDEGEMAGGIIEHRASGEAEGYLNAAELLTIGGVILIVAGSTMIILNKKKKKK